MHAQCWQEYCSGALHKVMSLGLNEKGRIIQNLCIFLVLLHCWQLQKTNPILLKKTKRIFRWACISEVPRVSLTEYLVNGVGQSVFLRGQGQMGQNDCPSRMGPACHNKFFQREKREKEEKAMFLPEWSGWMVPACREMFGGCLVVGGGGGSCNGATSFSSRWPTTSSVLVCQRPFLHVRCSGAYH